MNISFKALRINTRSARRNGVCDNPIQRHECKGAVSPLRSNEVTMLAHSLSSISTAVLTLQRPWTLFRLVSKNETGWIHALDSSPKRGARDLVLTPSNPRKDLPRHLALDQSRTDARDGVLSHPPKLLPKEVAHLVKVECGVHSIEMILQEVEMRRSHSPDWRTPVAGVHKGSRAEVVPQNGPHGPFISGAKVAVPIDYLPRSEAEPRQFHNLLPHGRGILVHHLIVPSLPRIRSASRSWGGEK